MKLGTYSKGFLTVESNLSIAKREILGLGKKYFFLFFSFLKRS